MASVHLREVIIRAVENVSDIVEITDDQGRLEYVNQAFEDRTGWSAEDVLGETPASFLRGGEHDEQYYASIWKTISSGQPWQGRMISMAKNGDRIIQEALVSPIQDAAGVVTHFIAIKRDITKRIQLERQLLQRDRLAAIGRLAAGVAHEINNPLTYILANIDFMMHRLENLEASLDHELHEELHEILGETSSGAIQIRDVVRSLGSLTRSNDSVEEVDLVEVIDFAHRLVDHDIDGHIDVVASYDGLAAVRGSRSQLTQVFVNLLSNAIQAMDGGDDDDNTNKISITGWSDAEQVIVQVKDNGAGMSAEVVERVFEPFFTTKEVGEGSGLGLSICYGLVTSMNGTIDVDSQKGVSTTFEVRLPMAEPTSTLADEGAGSMGAGSMEAGSMEIGDEESL
jgi:PAS domain S-box-containing protein